MLKSKKEVRVIIFLTTEIEDRYAKIPANYMSNSKKIPTLLVEEIKQNGWVDKSGNVCWRKDFEPKPVKAKDGNVYLALSDADIQDDGRHLRRLNSALEMLNL